MERILRKYLPSGNFDNVSKKRSKAMGAVKSSGNKTTEVRFRLALVRNRIKGWKVRPKGVKGNPDFIFFKKKIIIFVDGCFWHRHKGCQYAYTPKSRKDFWRTKFRNNVKRDKLVNEELGRSEWNVHRIWECEINENNLNSLAKIIKQ